MLQKLRLKQCPLVSDESLKVVAASCPRLMLLTFKDNEKVGRLGLTSREEGCCSFDPRSLFFIVPSIISGDDIVPVRVSVVKGQAGSACGFEAPRCEQALKHEICPSLKFLPRLNDVGQPHLT